MARSFGRLGSICLGIYLLGQGLALLIGLSFVGMPILLGILAIIAGVVILAGR
jgi:hypothetical protein